MEALSLTLNNSAKDSFEKSLFSTIFLDEGVDVK